MTAQRIMIGMTAATRYPFLLRLVMMVRIHMSLFVLTGWATVMLARVDEYRFAALARDRQGYTLAF